MVPKHWKTELGIYVALFTAVIGVSLYFASLRSTEPWTVITGEVVAVGMRSDFDGNHPMLTVQLPDGSQTRVTVSKTQLAQCAPGEQIALMKQGVAYRVGLEGCS
jgi:hypothetical protein